MLTPSAFMLTVVLSSTQVQGHVDWVVKETDSFLDCQAKAAELRHTVETGSVVRWRVALVRCERR